MITTIIVDDERPTLNRLERQINDSRLAEVSGAFTRPLEALEFLKENSVDAAYLDIELPGINGLELAVRITDLHPGIAVVFVTAYNQYAVEAFRLNAIDYLLKPVTNELLKESLVRVAKEIKPRISSGRLIIKCFGKFTAFADETKINFRTEKTKELLAFLIAQNGTFVSRDLILDSIWESFEGDRALVNFNTTLYNLRKALLPFGKTARIIFESGCYCLPAENIDCDYFDFCKLAEKKETVTAGTITEFEKALSLYTGEYLAGFGSLWAVQKKLRAQDQYGGLLMRLVNFHLSSGDKEKAYAQLLDGLEKEPISRELNYCLIKLLLEDNERIKAERYYTAYKEALQKQFNETPDDGFKRLISRKI